MKDRSTMDARDARKFLEGKKVPQLLEEYILDCAKQRPEDVLSHLAEWAIQKGGTVRSQHFAQIRRRSSLRDLGAQGKPLWTGLVVGSPAARESVMEIVTDWSVSHELSEDVGHYVQRKRLNIGDTANTAPMETPSSAAIFVDHEAAIDQAFLQQLSHFNVLVICVAHEEAEDLLRKRDGYLSQIALLAHASGIERAVGCIVGDGESSALSLVANCLKNAGFDGASCPIVPVANSASLEEVIDGVPAIPKKQRDPTAANSLDATVAVVGATISKGEWLLGTCDGAVAKLMVTEIVCLLDRKTGRVLQKRPPQLPSGAVGIIRLLVKGNTTVQIEATSNFAAVSSGTVVAVGTVSATIDDMSSSDSELSSDSSTFSV